MCDRAMQLYAEGWAALRAKKWSVAKSRIAAAVATDHSAEPIDAWLIENGPRRFFARRNMARWMESRLEQIHEQADLLRATDDMSEVHFSYWAQGSSNFPDVVEICEKSHQKHYGNSRRVFLDEGSWQRYAALPSWVQSKLSASDPHFSDLLRLAVLVNGGGQWFDATCFLTGDREVWRQAGSNFFAFADIKRGTRISNWMLASRPDAYIPKVMLSALQTYWLEHEKATHYLFFHSIFEVLLFLDSRAKKEWKQTSIVDREPTHALQRILRSDAPASEVDRIRAQTDIHKLRHRSPPDLNRLRQLLG